MGRRLMVVVAIIAGLALFTAGCRTAKEPDQVAFITGMGIDKAENGKIKVTYRIMIPRAVGGAQGGGQEIPGGPVLTTSFIAANTAEAHNLLSTTLSRYSNLTHLRGILISEEVARGGVADLIAPLARYREYRGRMFIFVVRGTTTDFVAKVKPRLDYLPSKLAETFMMTADESSYYASTDIHDFYIRLKEQCGSPYAAYVGLNPLSGRDKPAAPRPPQDRADAYLPGDIPRPEAGEPPEYAGVAVFAGDKMVGALDTREARILAMLQDKFPRGFFVLADPLAPEKAINIYTRNGGKPEIEVELAEGREAIRIKVFLEGDIAGIASGINYESKGYREQLESALAALVKEQIEDFIRHTQQLGSDVFGFGYYLRPKFATYNELRQANLDTWYKTARAEVQVTVKMRRTGLLWRTSPLRHGDGS